MESYEPNETPTPHLLCTNSLHNNIPPLKEQTMLLNVIKKL